jgi:hypothetical protein
MLTVEARRQERVVWSDMRPILHIVSTLRARDLHSVAVT